eukprot:Lithocolla_globosa_v1_NODE_7127_length_989_cov_1.700214.p2 type:complete len:134 gc:universal NODE_7127_length_989_cov_1.700214:378-779(+)
MAILSSICVLLEWMRQRGEIHRHKSALTHIHCTEPTAAGPSTTSQGQTLAAMSCHSSCRKLHANAAFFNGIIKPPTQAVVLTLKSFGTVLIFLLGLKSKQLGQPNWLLPLASTQTQTTKPTLWLEHAWTTTAR